MFILLLQQAMALFSKKNLYQSQFTNRKQIEKEVVEVTERKQLFFQRKSTEQIT